MYILIGKQVFMLNRTTALVFKFDNFSLERNEFALNQLGTYQFKKYYSYLLEPTLNILQSKLEASPSHKLCFFNFIT